MPQLPTVPKHTDKPFSFDDIGQETMLELMEEVRQRGKNAPTRSIERHDPNRTLHILAMLAAGRGIREISRATNTQQAIVRGLEWKFGDTLETKRKEYSQRYAIAAHEYTDLLFMKAERLHDDPEKLDNISPDKLALTAAIMTDKAMQLSGMATSVVEHRKGVSIDDAKKEIEEVRARLAQRTREVAVDAELVTQ